MGPYQGLSAQAISTVWLPTDRCCGGRLLVALPALSVAWACAMLATVFLMFTRPPTAMLHLVVLLGDRVTPLSLLLL